MDSASGHSAVDAVADYSPRRRMIAVAVLAAVLALDILDGTIVNVAVPSIQHGLHAGYSTIQWIVAGYGLSFALLLVTGGRLGDVFGYRTMFVAGIAGFTLASALCGIAASAGQLIGARLLQGAMAAMMAPQGSALVQIMYPPQRRAAVMGVFGTIGGLSAVLGPIIGGVLVQANIMSLGWRAVFLVNLPVGILALTGGMMLLPRGRSSHPVRPDWGGTAILMFALVMLAYPLVEGRNLGWPGWTLAMLAASIPALWAFWRYALWKDAQDGSALIVPALLRSRAFAVGLLVSLAFSAAANGFMICWTLLLQLGLGFSPIRTSLINIPFALLVGLSIVAVSRQAVWRLGRPLLAVGAATMAGGLAGVVAALVGTRGAASLAFWAVPGMAVAGLGMGLVIGPLSTIALGDVDVRHAGSAAGVLASIQQMGSAMGVAVGGTVLFSVASVLHRSAAGGFTSGFEAAVGLQIGLLAAAGALAFALPRRMAFMQD
jgi:MFS family permease